MGSRPRRTGIMMLHMSFAQSESPPGTLADRAPALRPRNPRRLGRSLRLLNPMLVPSTMPSLAPGLSPGLALSLSPGSGRALPPTRRGIRQSFRTATPTLLPTTSTSAGDADHTSTTAPDAAAASGGVPTRGDCRHWHRPGSGACAGCCRSCRRHLGTCQWPIIGRSLLGQKAESSRPRAVSGLAISTCKRGGYFKAARSP